VHVISGLHNLQEHERVAIAVERASRTGMYRARVASRCADARSMQPYTRAHQNPQPSTRNPTLEPPKILNPQSYTLYPTRQNPNPKH